MRGRYAKRLAYFTLQSKRVLLYRYIYARESRYSQ